MEPFSIAAKSLASLNMPDVDLRSFWYLLHLHFARPWDTFPLIFGDFDRRQKRLARLHIDRNGYAPESFGPFEEIASYLNVGRLRYVDQATNITINGEPDDVFVDLAGDLHVVDYKTAAWEDGNDPLLPLYLAQVSTYCFILEQQKRGHVAKAGLIYFEPVIHDSDDELLKSLTKTGMCQEWVVKPTEIEIDRKKTRALLKATRKLYDMDVPPECKRKNCKNCTRLDAVYQLCRSVDLVKLASAAPNQDGYFLRAIQKWQGRALRDALMEFSDDADQSAGGFDLWSHWEWPTDDAVD